MFRAPNTKIDDKVQKTASVIVSRYPEHTTVLAKMDEVWPGFSEKFGPPCVVLDRGGGVLAVHPSAAS